MWSGFEVVRVMKSNDGKFFSAADKPAATPAAHDAEATNHMAFAQSLSKGPNSKAAFSAVASHMDAASAHKDASNKLDNARLAATDGTPPQQVADHFAAAGAASDAANKKTFALK